MNTYKSILFIRATPNCPLHALLLNITTYVLSIFTSLLNASGKRLLHTAAQRYVYDFWFFSSYFICSDLLPDDFGKNTNKKRLRQFPSNIGSLVGDDVATLLPRLSVLFRFVLRVQYIRDDIKLSFLRNESNGILFCLFHF